MSQEIAMIVKDGQNVVSTNTVMEGSGATGRPLIVKAGSKQSIELKNVATGVAPDQVHVTKDGKNLKIKLGKKASAEDDSADIIIEDYYANDASLIGVAENGQYYNFIPQGTNPDSSYYSLGGDVIGEATETDWLPIALALLGAGALAALAGGGGGGNKDTTAPDSLTVNLTDDEGPIEAITTGTVTNDATPVISGVTEAGATLTAEDDAHNTLGSATADGSGNYTIIWNANTELTEGQHYISVTAADAAGNDITVSSVIFTVDKTPPAPPVLNPTDGSPITGTAEAGSMVTITYNDVTVTTTADGNGNFIYTPATPLSHGTEIVATATDAAGNESDPDTETVNSAVPDAPIVIDNVGDITGPIANNSTTDDTVPTITGSGAGASRPINIYDNGVLLGTTTSDVSGNWSFEPEEPFVVGSEHSISYTINGGPSSPDVNFAIEPPAVIDLGDDGQLINPVFVDGNYYYYWDRDKDGEGIVNGNPDQDDWFTHNELDDIFMYDVDGAKRPDNLTDTNDTYRYAELEGYQVALPTYGGDKLNDHPQLPTNIDNDPEGEINPTYDDLVAIWDAFEGHPDLENGITSENGTPPEWANGIYWSATPYETTQHYAMDLTNGTGGTNGETNQSWTAVQVIF
ncbi:MAG: Ig-like domain-containing protein [Sulfurovaceae bacterium]